MNKFPEILQMDEFELVRRRPTFHNAEMIFSLLDKNRTYFEQWLGWVNEIKSLEDCFGWLRNQDDTSCVYFIFKDCNMIGCVGFVKINEKAKSLDLGYWLVEEANGQGIIHLMIKLLEPVAFDSDWEVLRIGCDVLNKKSKKVAEKLGYVFEGTIRHGEPYPDGRRYDNSFFSKLKSEWLAEQTLKI